MLIFANEPFEALEYIFEESYEGKLTYEQEIEKVTRTIENWGFKEMEEYKPDHSENYASELQDKIKTAIDEDGTIIFYTGNKSHTTFVAVKKNEDEIYEIHFAIMNEGEYEWSSTDYADRWHHVADSLGFRIVPVNKTINGVVRKVNKTVLKSPYPLMKWFSNAFWIPQPFGMEFPQWLTEKIRFELQVLKLMGDDQRE